jgi:predicted HD phosphohydrolase
MKYLDEEILGPLFDILERCKGLEQMPEHHPEGDVFVHSLQVLHHALRESKDIDVILAAMLHDIGKIEDTKGHDRAAIKMLKGHYLSGKTLWLIEQHMRFWYYILGDMRKMSKVKELAEHPWMPDLLQIARWDKMGRRAGYVPHYDRERIIERLNSIALSKYANI